MAKPLSFKDFIVANPLMTDDEYLAYLAKKRKKDIPTGDTDEESTVEALDMTQRRKLAQRMKRNKARISLGRKRAEKKVANLDTLKKRARKQARTALAKKITKGIAKAELSPARKKEIEKRLDKPQMQNKITRIARKSLPKVRQAELQKKRGGGKKDD
jgi:hypothetical protein